MTTDPDAAVKFYAAIAGWGTQAWNAPGGGMPYTMWKVGETPIGGLMRLPEDAARNGAPSHWLAYVATPDVDATAKQTLELGGKILHGPEDIPTVGRLVVLADPQGAVFAAFTSLNPPMPDLPAAQIGQFSWHELVTKDSVKAFDFYATLFGWERTTSMDMGEMGVYQLYGLNGKDLGGMFNVPPGVPSRWLFYILVDSADSAAKRVTELGGKVLNGPMDIPGGGRIAQCLDPQGAAFAVHSMPAKK